MKLRALVEFNYANRLLSPGDEFDASERDGRVLTAVKRAEIASQSTTTRALKADDEPAPKKAAKKASKSTYNRRDMKAKD